MNDSPAANFIEKITGKNREIILNIIRELFYDIHALVVNEFYLPKNKQKLIDIKRNYKIADFSSAADLFRDSLYIHKKFPSKYNPHLKENTVNEISLIGLKKVIINLGDELLRENIKVRIQNEFFNINIIDEIATLVLDINNLRNRDQHEINNLAFSQACLLYSYLNRLIALTPDHILESVENYQEYLEFLNHEFKNLTKIYIPTEDDEETHKETKPKPDININDLAEKIAEQLGKENDLKDKEIAELKEKLEKNTPQYFYVYSLKKEHYEHSFAEGSLEKDARGFFGSSYLFKDKSHAYAWTTGPLSTSMWGGVLGKTDASPQFYIPFGAVQDAYGHIYKFHDKNDPFYSSANMDESLINLHMFSIEEIESSWGPFDEPLKVIRELSVIYEDENYTEEEWEAYSIFNSLWDENPEDVLSPRQLELVQEIKKRPPIVIPIKDWVYPEASYEKFDPSEEISPNLSEHAELQKDDLTKPTIETIIRKTRKETREQLLELRNKIYTIMTNYTVFDHWDNILNSKIIRNILNERIFLAEDFKTADIKPGYIWKTARKQQEEGYVKRDKESLELMDLQINQFWEEIQDVTRNYFFDYDYIYNNKGMPWVKSSSEYFEINYQENIDLYEEIFNYLHKIEPSIKKESAPFNEFTLSFIKALKRNIEEFPDDDMRWEEVGSGFVIKKLRK
tara:strand:+ start:157 stop:2202 length:2046 start_codon:yes stop_codon:yes gene_type:complete